MAWETVRDVEQTKTWEPLKFFTPNGAQEKVIKAVGNMDYSVIIECFANGVGKSALSCGAIPGAIMWDTPSTAFDYPLFRDYPSRWPKSIRIVTEAELVAEDGPIQVEAKKWWPKGRYTWSKGGKNYNRFCVTDTGFFVEILTYEQAIKAFEGKTKGPTFFVEPPPKEIFDACTARQRMGGFSLLDMTPLHSAAWVKDELVDKPEIVIDGVGVGKVCTVYADIEENCQDHGENGHLLHLDIMKMIARYDPDEKDARAHGKFMHLSGAIYKTFSRDGHVVEPHRPPEGSAVFQVIDPAAGKPSSVIWAYVDGRKGVTIFDEWPNYEFHKAKDPNLTVEDMCGIFKEKEADFTVQTRIMDRRYGTATHKMGEPTLQEDFDGFGFDFIDSVQVDQKEEIAMGIAKVREYLKWDRTKKMDVLNQPRIKITSNCKNTILAMERWSFDAKTLKPKDDRWKDFADCVRYLVSADPEIYDDGDWNVNVRQPHFGVGNK